MNKINLICLLAGLGFLLLTALAYFVGRDMALSVVCFCFGVTFFAVAFVNDKRK